MWEVPNEKLVAVWVADNSPVVYVSRFSLSPTTCKTGIQPKKSAPIKQASKITKNQLNCEKQLPLLTKFKCDFPACDSEDWTPSNNDKVAQISRRVERQ